MSVLESDWVGIIIVSFILLILPGTIIGAIMFYTIFPGILKKLSLIWKIIIYVATGSVTVALSFISFPFVLIFAVYLIGILFHIICPPKWDKIKIWTDVFKSGAIICGLVWFYMSIIMNFVEFQAKARSSEEKTNLASIATSEIAYYDKFHAYSNKFEIVGWSPQGFNKYSYHLSADLEPGTYIQDNWPAFSWLDVENRLNLTMKNQKYARFFKSRRMENKSEVLKETGLKYGIGISPDNFTAVAIGNIDNNHHWDVWLINKEKDPTKVMTHPEAKETVNLGIAEIFSDGFAIYPDRINVLFLMLNLFLWLTFWRLSSTDLHIKE